MPQTSLPDMLLDHERIRRHSMQSLFENLDAMCEGTVVVDRHARIVWINDRYATRLSSISADDAVGREIEEVIPNSLMREVVNSGQPILLDLLETTDATFVVTRIPIKDDDGVVIGAAGFALFDQVQSLKPQRIAISGTHCAVNRPCHATAEFPGDGWRTG
ncbi:MAG: PAS domain-containing protein [Propionivibrio sp.]